MDKAQNQNRLGLGEELNGLLRCLSCQGNLEQLPEVLSCTRCGRTFPIVNGIPRFVDAQHYADSFGFQWLKHDRTQLDDEQNRRSEADFTRKTGLRREDLEGKLVLDVGCGMGRYAEVVTRWEARVVGIDLSQAVEAAARNLADREAVIIQADVFSLPFRPRSFDLIYSLGVLHHTPSCEQAFKKLPGLLKPGGRIAIWLYSAYNPWYRFSDLYRKVTRRMPPRLLHSLCYATVPLYHVHSMLRNVPVVGRAVSGMLRYVFPMSLNRDPQWRVLDTFDWYSPWYQSKHTYEEVFRWFESCGLENLGVADVPISVYGRRPMVMREDEKSPKAMEVQPCVG